MRPPHPPIHVRWINTHLTLYCVHAGMIYESLRGLRSGYGYNQPYNPLFVDVGANIGKHAWCFNCTSIQRLRRFMFPIFSRCTIVFRVVCGVWVITGVHALFFGALGIRTHAFEPLQSNVQLLQCSAAANPKTTKSLIINDFGLADEDSDGACIVRTAVVLYVAVDMS